MYYQHRLALREMRTPVPLRSSPTASIVTPPSSAWLWRSHLRERKRDYVEESKMKGYGEKKDDMLLPVLVLSGRPEKSLTYGGNQKRAYEHPLEITGSGCKDGVLWVYLGRNYCATIKRHILLRVTIWTNWLIVLIRASWQVFEHLSLDCCLLKDLFLICRDWFICSSFLVSFLHRTYLFKLVLYRSGLYGDPTTHSLTHTKS